MTQPKRKKLNLDRVLTQIVALLGRHEPAALTFSRVSQLTKIPRSTLYYYFGNSRDGMLAEAIRFGMKSYVQLVSLEKKRRSYPDWHAFQRARMRIAAATVRKYPWAPTLYFRFRNETGPLGETIRDIENRYIQEMGTVWRKYHNGKAPDWRSERIASFVKLGVLWGFAIDPEKWFSGMKKAEFAEVLEHLTELVTSAMKKEY